MHKFTNSLKAWQTDNFSHAVELELQALGPGALPLQNALRQGSHIAEDEALKMMLISSQDSPDQITATVGIFFHSVIAGCSCADDPTPVDLLNEYCELELVIDKQTANTHFRLVIN